ncbi:heavy metal-binding domain-containing protein [Sphingobacterium anhuiense]|uniref:heavy metal-binding domain-containing protein n=1 Tax=Sphingobacterium anhuiense TaxID=493780 RepID=UPI003C2D4DE4
MINFIKIVGARIKVGFFGFSAASIFFNQTDHHKNPISTTAVIGANALSEIGSIFVDIFGGRSRNYENKLKAMNETGEDKVST